MLVDLGSAALRTLGLLAMFQAAGAAVFLAVFGAPLAAARVTVRRLGAIAATLAAAALLAFYALEAGRMAGEWSGVRDAELRALVWQANAPAILARGAGLLLIGIALRRDGTPVGLAGAALVAVSFALTGHATEHGVPSLAGALVALHVFLALCWFGALAPLLLVSRWEAADVAGAVVARFTRVATWSVLVIAVAGVALGYPLGAGLETLQRPYGILLLVKATLFCALMALAATNKWRYGPRLAADDRSAAAGFRRTVAFEFGLIAGVLAATAVLTTFYSPQA